MDIGLVTLSERVDEDHVFVQAEFVHHDSPLPNGVLDFFEVIHGAEALNVEDHRSIAGVNILDPAHVAQFIKLGFVALKAVNIIETYERENLLAQLEKVPVFTDIVSSVVHCETERHDDSFALPFSDMLHEILLGVHVACLFVVSNVLVALHSHQTLPVECIRIGHQLFLFSKEAIISEAETTVVKFATVVCRRAASVIRDVLVECSRWFHLRGFKL